MPIFLQVILCIAAFSILLLWYGWTFALPKVMQFFQLSATNSTGKNFLRGDIGGVLLAAGSTLLLSVFHNGLWIYAAMLIVGAVIFGRIISLLIDGYSKIGLLALIGEVIGIGIFYWASMYV